MLPLSVYNWHSTLRPIRKFEKRKNRISVISQNLLYTIFRESTISYCFSRSYTILVMFVCFSIVFTTSNRAKNSPMSLSSMASAKQGRQKTDGRELKSNNEEFCDKNKFKLWTLEANSCCKCYVYRRLTLFTSKISNNIPNSKKMLDHIMDDCLIWNAMTDLILAGKFPFTI